MHFSKNNRVASTRSSEGAAKNSPGCRSGPNDSQTSATTVSPKFLYTSFGSGRSCDAQSMKSSGLPESSLISKYEIREVLGFGSAGRVHVAVDVTTGKEYACKIVTERTAQEVQLREVELIRQLDHPNIVSYRDHFFCEDGLLHIVTELVRGTDLMSAIQERGSYAEEDAREVVGQLLSALNHVHSKGIAHRDLKPENVLVLTGDHTRVKIIDFGLGGQIRDGAVFTTACGTPNFVAPEVVQEIPRYGTACDVWSVGIILYVLLSGDFPFKAPNVPALISLIRRGVLRFRDPAWELVSSEAKLLVQSLCTIDQQQRPSAGSALRSCRWLNS